MTKILLKVLSKPSYLGLALAVSLLAFTFSVLLPNLLSIGAVFSSEASIGSKFSYLFSLMGSIKTNFTTISASYTIAIDLLFGINIALFTFYIRRARSNAKISGVGAGVGGMISGLFGIGCTACGTFILTSVLGIFGATGIIGFLPFGGQEFGFLGIGLLVFSIYIVLKILKKPLICPPE